MDMQLQVEAAQLGEAVQALIGAMLAPRLQVPQAEVLQALVGQARCPLLAALQRLAAVRHGAEVVQAMLQAAAAVLAACLR